MLLFLECCINGIIHCVFFDIDVVLCANFFGVFLGKEGGGVGVQWCRAPARPKSWNTGWLSSYLKEKRGRGDLFYTNNISVE